MTIGKLLTLIKDLPKDAVVMSDSGWECDATDCDGVYYSKKLNTLVLTQGYGEKKYFGHSEAEASDWETLSYIKTWWSERKEVKENDLLQ